MTKRSKVESFLAAPEATVRDERERAKLVQRKKQDDARLAREAASKSKDRPSQEDILADLVRVAEDEETNPFHKFRSLSQRRYELYGHYSIERVLELGRFEHLKQQAGLATTIGTRMLLNVRTERSLDAHDERYMRRYLLPHVNKFPELGRAATGWKSGLVISDLHGFYLDPFTWNAFLWAAEHLCPDVVYFNGDVIDGLEISTHPKVPGASVPLQMEFDLVRELMREMRATVPAKTRIVWGAGNHFLDRMTRYMTQVARAHAGLRGMRIDKLVELDDLDIELVQGGSFCSPKGQESQKPRKVLWDHYLMTHGTKLGATPAYQELQQWGMSGTSGHVHRAAVHYGATRAHAALTWMSTPMACVDDAGKWYIKDVSGWQQGFGVFYVHGESGRVHHYPVITDGQRAMVEGETYEAGELPTEEKAVREYWTKRFSINRGDYL